MTNKHASLLLIALILLVVSACQAQVELESGPPELSTVRAMPTKTIASEDIVTVAILEPVPPSPAAQGGEEIVTPIEPTNEPVSSKEDSVDQSPGTETAVPEVQPAEQSWVDQAKEDLVQRQSFAVEDIELVSFEMKTWPDSSFGCPQPGMSYLQVLTEGYLIQLRAGDEIYKYHGGDNREPFLCQQIPQTAIEPAPSPLKITPTKSVPPPRD